MTTIISRGLGRLRREAVRVHDTFKLLRLRLQRSAWPCYARKYLVVGCESSGTTPISHLLFRGSGLRFLIEGEERWVWRAYMSIYEGHTRVRDYYRLQLFDCLKVPGFAAILDHFVAEFPNTAAIYVVRDPRDVIVSACKTWRVTCREGLDSIPWVTQSWLGIQSEDPVARLAMRWRKYLEASQRVAGVIYVRYEDFCADKVGCITQLANMLGLRVDAVAIRRDCDRQASSKAARDYAPRGPGAWREGGLADQDVRTVEEICGEHMRRWRYL